MQESLITVPVFEESSHLYFLPVIVQLLHLLLDLLLRLRILFGFLRLCLFGRGCAIGTVGRALAGKCRFTFDSLQI